MNRRERSEASRDRWDVLARDLLGEEPEQREPCDTVGNAEAADSASEVERIELEASEGGEANESGIRESSEGEPAEALEEFPTEAEESGSDLAPDVSSSEAFVAAELPLEPAPAETPMSDADQPDDETIASAEAAEATEPPREKPRRTRRGRRRRSRRAGEEPAETETVPEVALDEPDVELDLDLTEDDGEEPSDEEGGEKTNANAIPTWAEAIACLSRGPEEGSSKRDGGGSRPRRRRRRGRSSQG